jgi:hypothetical protein
MKSSWVLGLLFGCLTASGQAKPGIYLTMNLELDLCDRKIKLLNTETVYCLTGQPILEFDSFERVDELVYDSLFEMRKFRIFLTNKGADYVNTVAAKLPDHKLALVVNGILVSVIDLDGIYHAGYIIVWDFSDSQAMEWIHRSLVKSVTANHK